MKNKPSKAFTFIFICLMFLLPKSSSATQLKFVVIGDSYSTVRKDVVTDPWPEQLRDYLDLPKSRYIISRKGGSGFTIGKTGKSFIQLVEEAKTSKANAWVDPKVTHVLVVGGIGNDLRSSKTKIKKQFLRFTDIARERFPNAQLLYAAPNWGTETARQEALASRKIYYRKLCGLFGWTYLPKTSSVLKNKQILAKGFHTDGHHPTQSSVDKIAKTLFQEIDSLFIS